MATIYDVSKAAKVAPSTVSLVFNNSPKVKPSTRKRVLEAAEELSYRPNFLAQGLRFQKTRTVGLVVPDIKNPTFSAIASGVEKSAKRRGYRVLLGLSDFDKDEELGFIDLVRTGRIDGLIISSMYPDAFLERLSKFAEERPPFVFLARLSDDVEADFVCTDLEKGGYLAIKHLIDLGHTRIGFVHGVALEELGQERLRGYKRALAEHNIPYDETLVTHCGYSVFDGMKAAEEFIKMQDRPTAIFALNDLLAISLMKGIKDSGLKVPQDIAIAGFDNIEYGRFLETPLTTVEIHNYETVEIALDQLINRIENPDSAYRHVVLQPQLIVRESCGAHQNPL